MTGRKAQGEPGTDAVGEARRLWCGAFHGVLSTQSVAEPGFPFGSVVPLCRSNAGEPILLLSHLAQHSHNLAADPRAALTLFDAGADDIQQGRRLTCLGRCEPWDDADALTRWCRHFPNGRRYTQELNFRLHRFAPLRCHYNGGFATARWIGVDRLLEGLALDADTEQALLAALTEEHAGWLERQAGPGCPAPPQPAGCDPLGITLRCGERLLRYDADTPLREPADLAAALGGDGIRRAQ
jgi:hypothetical protein